MSTSVIEQPQPFYFPGTGTSLFGIFHGAAAASGARPAVLICGPRGEEAVAAHRVLRVLAVQLARRGFPVLRFDLPGCADSAGDDEDCSLEACLSALQVASNVLRERAPGHPQVCIGLRYGAHIVASAVRASGAFRSVVLWDPVIADLESANLSSPGENVLVADSNGQVAQALAQLAADHPLRRAELLENRGPAWDVLASEETVAVPGSLIAAIVKHGESRW